MSRSRKRKNPKRILALPDLAQAKASVLIWTNLSSTFAVSICAVLLEPVGSSAGGGRGVHHLAFFD